MKHRTPAQSKDTEFLGWVIGVCSALFLSSLLVMSSNTTHMASFQTPEATSEVPR